MVRLCVAVVVCLGGCAVDAGVASVEQASSSGYVSQGTKMQGTKMQGTKMQGTKMQGTKMQGTRMQGTKMQGVRLDGTVLAARALVLPSGTIEAGWELGGVGSCAAGSPVTVTASGSGLRVCSGSQTCDDGGAIAGGTGLVSFGCPGSGSYTVLEAGSASVTASPGAFPLTHDVAGPDFIGATLLFVDDSGDEVPVRVDDVVADAADAAGDVFLYSLSAQDETTGAWFNICEPGPDGTTAAIPLAGTWDDGGARVAGSTAGDLVTFACTSGVLAKCARWGYKPWRTMNGVGLASYHQACTRMARADYCGNGTPHTQDGTLIDVFDSLPIQQRSGGDPLMVYEAAWTENGAYCVTKWRWDLSGVQLLAECPQKLALPSLSDALRGCAMKLTSSSSSAIRTHNDSHLNLSLLQ